MERSVHLYEVQINPAIDRKRYSILGDKLFAGFFLLIDRIINVPRFVVDHKRTSFTISLIYSHKLTLTQSDLTLIQNFREIYEPILQRTPIIGNNSKLYRMETTQFACILPAFSSPNKVKPSFDLNVLEFFTRSVSAKDYLQDFFKNEKTTIKQLREWTIMNNTQLELAPNNTIVEHPEEDQLIEDSCQRLKELINGRVVVTEYNGMPYLVSDTAIDLSPESSFQLKKGEPTSFVDYYKSKRGLLITDHSQPLFINGSLPKRPSSAPSSTSETTLAEFFYPTEDSVSIMDDPSIDLLVNSKPKEKKKSSRTNPIMLVPELCQLLNVTAEMCHFGRLIPCILVHVELYIKLERFEEAINYKFNNRGLLRQACTHPSYCNDYEGVLTNYQRMEFLGDSILEHLVTHRLYEIFPFITEGRLTSLRSSIVNNHVLSLLALKLNLDDYLIISAKQGIAKQTRVRILADVFEALLAALYLDGGMEVAERLLTNTLFDDLDPSFQCFWKDPTSFGVKMPRTIPETELNNPDLHCFCDNIEKTLGVAFAKKHLLIQAFTHPSHYAQNNGPQKTETAGQPQQQRFAEKNGHYQRMEFLGDSILNFVVSDYLYRTHPTADEGQLTICRARMVNNETLCKCIKKLNVDHFLRHNCRSLNAETPQRTKACGDLFESTLAAILLDRNDPKSSSSCSSPSSSTDIEQFHRCYDFVRNTLLAFNDVDLHELTLDPKSLFQHLMQCHGSPLPQYTIVSEVQNDLLTEYTVEVRVDSELVGMGIGNTIKEAKRRAAESATEAYFKDDHYHLDPDQIALWPFNEDHKRKMKLLRKDIENSLLFSDSAADTDFDDLELN
eukprot:TRINITY_DN2679_c0_g1_i2.p1 TRINITY_DN2679_c0_g1~~TRINITY_DN2679_c0_g1_i2.p1  ORF type:complete len:840 (+),score=189.72 TRINITY_DN2679_c0_g1_i2:45-2564(+)